METDKEIRLLRERIVELDEDNLALLTELDSLRVIGDAVKRARAACMAVIEDGNNSERQVARLVLAALDEQET